ncbi:unnamed protein product [Cyprideis torosa]|uniref:Uncharacterized protein n=1 Tax=Cyprideis torosa TaxID=163714 RepID=A0A7R8WMW0_9CRUS|nr:unnamed protein product [Cyprideis torosa]CAG0899932.1 unnamed protein product [Cyprideis torosa]
MAPGALPTGAWDGQQGMVPRESSGADDQGVSIAPPPPYETLRAAVPQPPNYNCRRYRTPTQPMAPGALPTGAWDGQQGMVPRESSGADDQGVSIAPPPPYETLRAAVPQPPKYEDPPAYEEAIKEEINSEGAEDFLPSCVRTMEASEGYRESISIHWFRHGLRFHDNLALEEAIFKDSPRKSNLLPIFTFDGISAGKRNFLALL